MALIEKYIPVVGESVVEELQFIARKLQGKVIQNINSTAVGGGVAEILNRIVPLLNDLGVDVRWDVIKGGTEFFDVTKKIHNLIHGRGEKLEEHEYQIFLDTTKRNIEEIDAYGDIVFVHDPQPIGLIEKKGNNKWIWRCHIDISNPDSDVLKFLYKFLGGYDASVFSSSSFFQKMDMRQFLITPSIDPLSDKNKDIPESVIEDVLKKYAIKRNKPIITQISRFDRLKDPVGVIECYKLVKKHIDCQLVLAGGTATDDPESLKVLEEVTQKGADDRDIHILLLPHSDIEVNALQRASDVILQKSLKEGFGLTVSEALWKEKPVVASNVGGIRVQIKHKYSGMLCHSIEGAAFALKQLLQNPAYAKKLAKNGKEHVKNNFLITRHLKEYMLLFLSLYNDEDIVHF